MVIFHNLSNALNDIVDRLYTMITNPFLFKIDSCSQDDYEVTRLRLLSGTGCKNFCHCAHNEGSAGFDAIYYWEEQTCPEGTLFDVSLDVPGCNLKDVIGCPGSVNIVFLVICPMFCSSLFFLIILQGLKQYFDVISYKTWLPYSAIHAIL